MAVGGLPAVRNASESLNSCLWQLISPVLIFTKHFYLNFVYNTFLRGFQNNADVSNFDVFKRK
jgi:hypothetical protein